MGSVRSLPQEFRVKEYEEEILKFWEENKVYEKIRKQSRGKPKYYFLDGPPYPSSDTPHIGTLWNKILKDSVIRFWRAQGYDVHDQPGYDCHGLPIEVKVEQELGFKTKKDIEKYGVDRFIKRCEEFALRNVKSMTKHFWSFGVSMDWENPYLTLDSRYVENAWWVVKKAYEKGLLDRGVRVVHWCPRCETTLADYEVSEYRMLRDPSIYVKFPVRGQPNRYILIWTTTPWTLPANVFVMAHPELEYAWVDVGGEQLLIVRDRVEPVMEEAGVEEYKVLEVVPGKELEGLEYIHPLVEEVEVQKKLVDQHRVVLSEEFVTAEEGTGLVHSAPGHGEEDFQVGVKYGSPVVSPVDDRGYFTGDAGKYAGKYVKEANREIIEDLRRKGYLFYEGEIEHRYPICWRCKTPLILRATRQWFIRVTQMKDRFLEEAARVNWIPEWAGYSRFKNWLQGLRDWIISRQRYWGTPAPIWVCKNCNHRVVVGSLRELEGLAGGKLGLKDLHKPWIDNVVLNCPKCGGEMRRVPDVLDVWLDSGVAFYASLGYPSSGELFEKLWPVDFITEGHDQIAGWFFSLLRCGLITLDKAPYRTVLMHGFALDEQGREMHKSLGNYVAPQEVLEFKKGSRDILRWYVLRNTIWEDLRFSWRGLEQVFDELHIVWNVYYFASTYMSLDRFDPEKHPLEKYMEYLHEEDKWILSRVENLTREVTEYFKTYHIHRAARLLRDFIVEDVSRWYIRLIRPRVWIERDDPEKLSAYAVLYYVLLKFLQLASPIIPFTAEKLYRDSLRTSENMPESIHMLPWPSVEEKYVDPELEKAMKFARRVVEAGLAARMKAGIKIRQPLPELIVATGDKGNASYVERMKNVVMNQVNVKKVTVVSSVEDYYTYRAKPVYKALGPVFKGDARKVADAILSMDGEKLYRELEGKGVATVEVGGEKYEVTREMVEFEKTTIPGYVGVSEEDFTVLLDTRIREEDLAEGFARDVLRRIQFMRKEMNLPIDAYVDVTIYMPPDAKKLFEKFAEYVAGETRAKKLQVVDEPDRVEGDHIREWEIEEVKVLIGVKRV